MYLSYEIAYETSNSTGTTRVTARSDKEALRLFREQWEQYGDEAPICWIVGRWSVNT